jgi:hypothetical protein
MKWIPITKKNVHTLKAGEKVKFHNGYEWDTDILDKFWISRGYISTGLHNETAHFLYPMFGKYVYVLRKEV